LDASQRPVLIVKQKKMEKINIIRSTRGEVCMRQKQTKNKNNTEKRRAKLEENKRTCADKLEEDD
jgi:hypothetical protein